MPGATDDHAPPPLIGAEWLRWLMCILAQSPETG